MYNRKYANKHSMLINTKELQELTGLGRDSAKRLATDAGAKVVVGRLIYWNRAKVEAAIEQLSE